MEFVGKDYMHLKFGKTNKLIGIFIGIIVVLYTVYFFSPNKALSLSKAIEIILIFTMTITITTIFKFTNRGIFKLIIICFLTLALLKFNTLIYVITYLGEEEIIKYINLKSVSICIILESLYCFIAIAHLNSIGLKTKIIVYSSSAFSLANIFLQDRYASWVISSLSLLLILYYLRNLKLRKDNLLNHFKLLILINLSLTILEVITYKFNLHAVILFSDSIKIGMYILVYIWILDIFIRKPYESLNKDMIYEDIKIDILNKNLKKTNSDIEEFRKNLRDKEMHFKTILDNFPKAIVILSSKNYRVFKVNKNFMEELGLKNRKDIINKNLFKILNIKNKDEFLISKKCETYFFKDGIKVFLKLDMLSKSKDYLIISIENITDLKDFEVTNNNIKKRNIKKQVKSDFLSSISHDLKTPINVIYSSIQMQEKIYLNKYMDKVYYYNKLNNENCTTLLKLTNNLIDSSEIDYEYLKPNFKIYNIVKLVEDSIETLAEYIKGKNLIYIFDTNEEEIYIKCDQEFIQRIVLNIVSNSIKHTNEGGVRVYVEAKKNKVTIDFTDTGEGMDEELLERAFLRYSKGDKKGSKNKSTGIGLYVVKGLVELQKGTIKINSIKDVGTNIRLEFNREKSFGV